MKNEKKVIYLQTQLDRLTEENRQLRLSNSMMKKQIEDFEKAVASHESTLEEMKQHVEECERQFAEETEKAHEARLAYEDSRRKMMELREQYRGEMSETEKLLKDFAVHAHQKLKYRK